MANVSRPLADRFWEKVDKTDGCWLWRGAQRGPGYGTIWGGKANPVFLYAHRVAYELQHGPIPDDRFVCHRCDTPLCVRGDHLYAGTAGDNIRDAVVAGHRRGPYRRAPDRAPREGKRGAANANARLTDDAVRAMRAMRATGASYAALGRAFGVSARMAGYVVLRRNWAHVESGAHNTSSNCDKV